MHTLTHTHTHTHTHLNCHRHSNPFDITMKAHQRTPHCFYLFSLWLTLVYHLPPSLSIHARCLLCICLSKKKRAQNCFVGFVSFCFAFRATLLPFLSPSSSSTPLPVTKGHDHTLSSYSTYLSLLFLPPLSISTSVSPLSCLYVPLVLSEVFGP